jgi:hypothetical protein
MTLRRSDIQFDHRILLHRLGVTALADQSVCDLEPNLLVEPRELVAHVDEQLMTVTYIFTCWHIRRFDCLHQLLESLSSCAFVDLIKVDIDRIGSVHLVFCKARAHKDALKRGIHPAAPTHIWKAEHYLLNAAKEVKNPTGFVSPGNATENGF